jgi:hypothetical protein
MRIRVEVGKSCSGSGSNVLVLARRGGREGGITMGFGELVHAKDLNWV